MLYLRFYQKLVTVPLLGKLFTQVATSSNLRIAHQDRRVVVTQQPRASGLAIGEKLAQGDRPIVEYRRRRHEWMERAKGSG